MRIADFTLERYFARWEFAARYVLCASDVQGYPMADLLELADGETRALWADLRLGYTVSTGHPLLRGGIATLYDTIEPDDAVNPLSLNGRLALQLQTKFDKERDSSFEVFDNDADVVHP